MFESINCADEKFIWLNVLKQMNRLRIFRDAAVLTTAPKSKFILYGHNTTRLLESTAQNKNGRLQFPAHRLSCHNKGLSLNEERFGFFICISFALCSC